MNHWIIFFVLGIPLFGFCKVQKLPCDASSGRLPLTAHPISATRSLVQPFPNDQPMKVPSFGLNNQDCYGVFLDSPTIKKGVMKLRSIGLVFRWDARCSPQTLYMYIVCGLQQSGGGEEGRGRCRADADGATHG